MESSNYIIQESSIEKRKKNHQKIIFYFSKIFTYKINKLNLKLQKLKF